MSGTISLGDIAARMGAGGMLEVSCGRCERRGRLRLEWLIEDHGAAMLVPALRPIIAANCPRMIEGKMYNACGVHFPELAELFR